MLYDYFAVVKFSTKDDLLSTNALLPNIFIGDQVLVSMEKLDTNPHLHIMGKFTRKPDAQRKYFKSRFNPAPHGLLMTQGYKVSQEASAVYISKENHPHFNTLYSPEELAHIIELTEAINLDKADNGVRPRRKTYCDKIVENYTPLAGENDWAHNLQDEHIVDYMLDNVQGAIGLKHFQEISFGIMTKHYRPRMKAILLKSLKFN